MLHDKNDLVRATAAMVCGMQGRAEALPVLREELLGDYDFSAILAIAGLAKLGTPEARRALEEATTKAKFLVIRQMAARTLKDGLVPAMTDLFRYRGRRTMFTINAASQVLLCLNDPAALPALEEARKKGDAEVRAEAARVIEHLRRRLPPPAPNM